MALATSYASAADCFKMKAMRTQEKTIPIKRDVVGVKAFCPFPKDVEAICGLSVSGTVEKENEDYFVRIILKDKEGMEYLVLESYEEINDDHSFVFNNYCEETALLANGAEPDSIKVVAKYAKVTLDKIAYHPASVSELKSNASRNADAYKELRKEQLTAIVDKINAYNISHNKLWRAGVTRVSQKSYEAKKRVMGFFDESCTDGIEYYIGGIFEAGSKQASVRQIRTGESSLPFVEHFDWRDRHGRNWMTSIKDQGSSGYCGFFTTAGSIEAVANLYYNRLLGLNLSEQEIASCHDHDVAIDPYISGVELPEPLEYVRDNGVSNELSYPFVDLPNQCCLTGSFVPDTIVNIDGFHEYNMYALYSRGYLDSLKYAIINRGPLASGIIYRTISQDDEIHVSGHGMVLVGFGTIQQGDTIKVEYNYGPQTWEDIIFDASDDRIGGTYWIYKNSWGEDSEHDGYLYLYHTYPALMTSSYSIDYPIGITTDAGIPYYTTSDILCTDADGDGYYFWGIGPKPAHCPIWAPDTPDGDDSNINYGPMDEYGNLSALPQGITIKSHVYYSQGSEWIFENLGIVDGGQLTISCLKTLSAGRKIRVCEGGALIIDGGILGDANLELVPGSTLVIKDGGELYMRSGSTLTIPENVTLIIDDGEIDNSHISLQPGSTLIVRNGGRINLPPETSFTIPVGANVQIEEGTII